MPLKQEGGSTDRPLGGCDQAPFWMSSERLSSGSRPDPPGNIAALFLVEAICLVTLAVTHFSGGSRCKSGVGHGMASIPTEHLPCPSLSEDLTCDPIQLQNPLWQVWLCRRGNGFRDIPR